jgi:hypothetical protein
MAPHEPVPECLASLRLWLNVLNSIKLAWADKGPANAAGIVIGPNQLDTDIRAGLVMITALKAIGSKQK